MVESLAGRKIIRKPVRRVYIRFTISRELAIFDYRDIYIPIKRRGITSYEEYTIEMRASYDANVRMVREQMFKTFLRSRKRSKDISISEAEINPFDPYFIHERSDFLSKYTIVKHEYVTKSGNMVDFYMTFGRVSRFGEGRLLREMMKYHRSSVASPPYMATIYNDDQLVHAVLL